MALTFFDFFAIEFNGDISPLVDKFNISGGIKSLGGPNINPLNCTILDNCVFENFILASEPFAKALQSFAKFLLKNLKLFLLLLQ